MKKIGITGGVGSGKSALLQYLKERYGAYVIVADELAKSLEQPGEVCYEALKEAFGDGILAEDGRIENKAFAAVIFSDEEARKKANAIIHPAVRVAIEKELEEQKAAGCRLFVLEAALLIEEGYDVILDELWYIYVPEEIRIKRLEEQRGYSREKSLSIMRGQKRDMEFRMHCARIIDNGGELWESEAQLDAILLGEDMKV